MGLLGYSGKLCILPWVSQRRGEGGGVCHIHSFRIQVHSCQTPRCSTVMVMMIHLNRSNYRKPSFIQDRGILTWVACSPYFTYPDDTSCIRETADLQRKVKAWEMCLNGMKNIAAVASLRSDVILRTDSYCRFSFLMRAKHIVKFYWVFPLIKLTNSALSARPKALSSASKMGFLFFKGEI